MHTLKELYDHLISLELNVKEFTGWYIKIGKDTWTLDHEVFRKNGEPQNMKDKNLFNNYKRKKQNVEHQSDKIDDRRRVGGGSRKRNPRSSNVQKPSSIRNSKNKKR